MATKSDIIQACMLRSLCPRHSATFERFHTNFPKFAQFVDEQGEDCHFMLQLFTKTGRMTRRKWELLHLYVRFEGREFSKLCRHWGRYGMLCIDNCRGCKLMSTEGEQLKQYQLMRGFILTVPQTKETLMKNKKRFPESMLEHFVKEKGRMKKLCLGMEPVAPREAESEGSN